MIQGIESFLSHKKKKKNTPPKKNDNKEMNVSEM